MTDHHETLTYVRGLGRPRECVGYGAHRPRPLRYVWHHVLPQSCGGKTEPSNLIALCDVCHYAVHELMFSAVVNGVVPGYGTRAQRAFALQGYQAAVAAGTTGKIPNEGGLVADA